LAWRARSSACIRSSTAEGFKPSGPMNSFSNSPWLRSRRSAGTAAAYCSCFGGAECIALWSRRSMCQGGLIATTGGVTVRELYACQLDIEQAENEASVIELTREWVARGSGTTVDELRSADDDLLKTKDGHQIHQALGSNDADAWTCSWRRPDETEPNLVWRVLLACGASPENSQHTRFSIRIRLERAGDEFRLVPLGHSFRAPAIVRTLLRVHHVTDSDVVVEPSYRVRRASDVAALVDMLKSPERTLPVLVVTRGPSPEHAVDAGELARQVAGLAHVEVLSTHLASLALTDAVGRDLSVWGGGLRLYWPGLALTDDPPRHRLWTRERLSHQRNIPQWFLSYLGALGAATVPEHPVVEIARAERRAQALDSGELPDWVTEYIESLEEETRSARSEVSDFHLQVSGLEDQVQDLKGQLADTRQSFNTYREHLDVKEKEDVDLEALDVAAAYRLAREEAPSNVVFLPEVDDSVAAFSSYKLPRRLYEALTAVNEVATAWADNELSTGFGEFFASRGYEYSKSNPAATAKKTRKSYQRRVDGELMTMEPHLKVDQSTSPDQCLRIYWWRDDSARRLVVGHVGRHLPD